MTTKTFASNEQRLAKNKQIAKTRKATKERRSKMKCQVFHLKIIHNKSSKEAQKELKQVFNQAKWLRNHILSLENINNYNSISTVPVKTPNGYENRELDLLGSQVKQAVHDQIKNDIKALSASKKNGNKIGKLKFVREIKSLNLKQINSTYRFNKRFKKVKIQGLKNWYWVRGADQLIGKELANAKLLKKADGYYIAITAYSNYNIENIDNLKNSIGIDFGVKTHFTLSDGREFNVKIVETEHLRRLQKKLSRQIKGSNNYHKTILLIRKEYLKLSYLKEEAANKFVSGLLKEAKIIYFQDDNFNSWKKKNSLARGSKTMQYSILGRVKQKMMKNDRFKKVDRFAATSKTCVCGVVNKDLSLNDRWFNCSSCGYSAPRDVHAAINMKNFYKSPAECGSALVEEISDSIIEQSPVKQETDNFVKEDF